MTNYPEIRVEKYFQTDKNDLFTVCEDCWVEILGPGEGVLIPAGFVTDFASVPQWMWGIIPPHGKMANAAIVHDYMYDNRQYERVLGIDGARAFANALFLSNMLRAGVPSKQAHLYYLAVRWFGKKWWVS